MALQQSKQQQYLILCLLVALVMPGLCTAAASQMRPGQWEVTVQMDMPGLPPQAQQAHTTTQCVTPEQANNPRAAMEKLNKPGQGAMKCTMTHFDKSGNTAQWSVDCTGAHPAHMDGAITYDSDQAYHGTMKMAMQAPQGTMAMTQLVKGRRIGECKP